MPTGGWVEIRTGPKSQRPLRRGEANYDRRAVMTYEQERKMKRAFFSVLCIAIFVGLVGGCVTGPGQGNPFFDLGYAVGRTLKNEPAFEEKVCVVPVGTNTPTTSFSIYGPRPVTQLFWPADKISERTQCEIIVLNALSGDVVSRLIWLWFHPDNVGVGESVDLPGEAEIVERWWTIPGQYYVQFWVAGVLKSDFLFGIHS